MALSKKQKEKIKSLIQDIVEQKIKTYKPESTSRPFHTSLIGEEWLRLYSFVHSLSTSLGASGFETISEIIAEKKFVEVQRQFTVGDRMPKGANSVIDDIVRNLENSNSEPSHDEEYKRLREACSATDETEEVNPVKVDLFLRDDNNNVYLIELKTPKPNISNFSDFKRTLLKWMAVFIHRCPEANVQAMIAMPYNPYAPKPYDRWTNKNILDRKKQLYVGEEFWNFLSKQKVYKSLLNCFEQVGNDMRGEIKKYLETREGAEV